MKTTQSPYENLISTVPEKALAYTDYYRLKVAAGQQSIRAGLGIPNEEAEAFFAAKRERTLRYSS